MDLGFVKYYLQQQLNKLLDKCSNSCILDDMSQLATINQSTKRKLTEKQTSFLDHLIQTKGDARQAAELAGYKSSHYHLLRTLKQEVLDITQEILASSAPKAAFKLLEIMDSNKPIPQAANKLQAAQSVLDRVGVVKTERLDITHSAGGGIFLLPEKEVIEVNSSED
jgi:hypothetical protein